MLGIEALLDMLAAADVKYIFGNPGSTELPLNDALANDDRFEYIFGLQEIPVTAMADGYALASGDLGVLCIHIAGGLGNAMGMLYNAHAAGTPLLVLAGQQDRRLLAGEPVLAGDLVAVARPWTKWAVEVHHSADVPAMVRRAVQVAQTSPTGPVFLSLPVDVQLDELTAPDLAPPHIPDQRVRPPLAAIQQAAALLAQAQNPAILAGSRVLEADAADQLVALAEQIGAPVFAEQQTTHGRLPMPSHHDLYAGPLPLWSPDIHEKLAPFDVVLAVGLNVLRLYIYHEPACPIPDHIRLIHLDSDPWEVGKNYPPEVGLLGDPQAGLAELAQTVREQQTAEQVQAAADRRGSYADQRAAERAVLLAQIKTERAQAQQPMTPLTLMGTLAEALPADTVMVEEAATTHNTVLEKLGFFTDPANRIAHRGWALGWGVGAAVGVKLAWPEKPVLALLGDGAALYGIQGLWTAAALHLPVVFLIANNTAYQILKNSSDKMGMGRLRQADYPAMHLVDPEIDFVGLAQSFGVAAHRVTTPDELADHIRAAFEQNEPVLLDVPITR